MGVCQNIPNFKSQMRENAKISKNQHTRISDQFIIIPGDNLQMTNISKNYQESVKTSKIYYTSLDTNNKLETNPSNISINSTCVQTNPLNKPQNFKIEATIGEIEIPIIVEKKEKIIIQINQNVDNNENFQNNDISQNKWSFFEKEKSVNYLGYNNHKYKNINIGALLMRITGDKRVYHINKTVNQFITNNKGNLLFYANLDPSYYMIYEPKGSISISVLGGNYIFENDLYYSYNINSFSNNYKINYDSKEYKILDYMNKARKNIQKFYREYYSLNDVINQEFKDFIINGNIYKRNDLKMNKELNDLAKKHCEDLCENETAGHFSSDGLDLKSRFDNNYKCYYFGESIIYNVNNPLFIVKNMLQDKYSKKKKNRNNLFFNQFHRVGICLKEHPIYKFCCVIVFSE